MQKACRTSAYANLQIRFSTRRRRKVPNSVKRTSVWSSSVGPRMLARLLGLATVRPNYRNPQTIKVVLRRDLSLKRSMLHQGMHNLPVFRIEVLPFDHICRNSGSRMNQETLSSLLRHQEKNSLSRIRRRRIRL